MRIAVVNLPSVDGGGLSILRDLHEFAWEHDEHEWLFVLGGQSLEAASHVRVVNVYPDGRSHYKRLRAELFTVRRAIREFAPDVTLSLQNTKVVGVPGPQFIYLHQPLPFQDTYRFAVWRRGELDSAIRQHVLGWLIKRSLASVDGAFVQTEWVKEAVVRSRWAPRHVLKVGMPRRALPQEAGRPEAGSAPKGLPSADVGRTFFYPAGPAIYKNFERLHRAVRQLETSGHPSVHVLLTLTEEEFRQLARPGDDESLAAYTFLGRISSEEVQSHYRESVLLFPSFIETLGLPLLEARQAGRFVLSADCVFAREVLEDYPNVHYFDPFDVGSIAEAMAKVLNGEVRLTPDVPSSEDSPGPWEIVLGTFERLLQPEAA